MAIPRDSGGGAPRRPQPRPRKRPVAPAGSPRRFPLATPEVTRSAPPRRAPRPPAAPRPHGRRNQNVFTTPVGQKPFAKQQRQAARHVARAILEVHGTAPKRPLKDSEVRQVIRSPRGRAIIQSARRITDKHPKHRSFFDSALHFALNQAADTPGRVVLGPSSFIPGVHDALRAITKTAPVATVNTLRALTESGHARTKTLKGFGALTAGAVAAIPEIAIQTGTGTLHGDPLRGVRQVVRMASRDISRRYGPIYRGDPGAARKFRERIKREGAASELVDLATLAVPEGVALGRGAGAVARSGALGSRAQRFASAARPGLRISGEAVRQQEVSRNLIRLTGQRAQDRARRRAATRRASAETIRGLQPRQGEVVARTLVGQRRLQRIEQSKLSTRGHEGFKNELTKEVHKGARRELTKLSSRQRRAAYGVLQGYIDASSPKRAVETLRARNAKLLARRAEEDLSRRARGLGPARYGPHLHDDELKLNGWLIDHAQQVFGDGKLKAFQETEAERSIRVARESADAHPAFKSSTAEVRRLRTQGDEFGIKHGYDEAAKAVEDQYHEGLARLEEQSGRVYRAEPDPQGHGWRIAFEGQVQGFENRLSEKAARAGAASRNEVRRTGINPLERQLEGEYLAARDKLDALKPEADAKYVAAVRAEARRRGLPEPAYVAHHPRGDQAFSDFAAGGARAIQGVRQSQMKLHGLGIADTRPERYIQSLARTIKYAHNWPTVVRQAETHAFNPTEFGSKAEIADIIGRKNADLNHLSIEDWHRILKARRLNPRDYAFWHPGRMRQAKTEIQHEGHPLEHLDPGTDLEGSAPVFEGWQRAAVDEKRLREMGSDSVFLRDRGWKVIPKAVYDEITAGTHPSGLGGRVVQKVQGFQSRVLLGTNPSWLQMQVAANAILTGFGAAAKGSLHPIQAQRWYRALPADAKQAADEALSLGVLQEHGAYTHLGASTDAKIVGWVRGLSTTEPFARPIQAAKRANPINLLFKGDDAQNKFFRKTLLYSSVKRQALQDIKRGVSNAYEHEKRIAGVLGIRNPKARMVAIMKNPQLFEKHAQFVNDILGDYSRYTARERRTLRRFVLFYGFMRYALKTLFYTLPVKHPLAMAVTAKLAQLHNEEVKDLLGGDQAPWAFSRIFFEGKNGQLKSIDLARANPVTSPVIGLVTEGPKALAGLFSPLGQEVADQIYGKQLYTNLGYRVKGSAAENPNPDLETRGRIALNHMLSTNFIVREGGKLRFGGKTQGDDALLWSPRPLNYKTPQAQARERQRRRARGTGAQQVKQDLLPLVLPKPDTTRDIIAAQERRNHQRITVPSRKRRRGTGPIDWSSVDWSKAQGGAKGIDWSSVDWSKAR